MPGYSAARAARKLGIKPDSVLMLLDAPAGWAVPDLPAGVDVRWTADDMPDPDQPADPANTYCRPDVVLAFARTAAVLHERIGLLATVIYPAGAVWIAWPRKAGGHVSDMTENLIREVALPLGLVDNKVAAIDDDWSGLRLSWRRELRRSYR
ncbi:MAG TPA: DUF3052 domain-containing protein [Mycobacteriales bacterium]|nr:DUF3052 domain-containing protein [Mycobacteriales bacterium]